MNDIFEDLLDQGHVVIYLDDILIFHDSLLTLRDLTHAVLQRLGKFDLYLKPEKCSFDKTSIEYLGVIIADGQVRMDPAKVTGITQWPVPTTVKETQVFLGFCNFYHHFIANYSAIAHPLFDLTLKDTAFQWTPAHHAVFAALISQFTQAPVLALPDHTQPFRLITDTSDFATGAILEQPDLLNCWHPIAYFSKSLQPAEHNYAIHDKELLAIIRALAAFRHYLEGCTNVFEIWSDHVNLLYFASKQRLNRRQACWSLFLSNYSFIILHKPGSSNHADPLSRCPDLKEGMLTEESEEKTLLNTKYFTIRALQETTIPWKARLRNAQNYDTEVSQALEAILKNGPRSLTKGLEDWNLEDGLILHRDIVKTYHESLATGHPGRWKTYELVSRDYWWPGMSAFIHKFVEGCTLCQTTKNQPRTQVPLQPNPVPEAIWSSVTMDFITDLPISLGFDSLFVVVDRFSKATIIVPCCKTITADETSQLYMNNVWRRTGLPQQIISDRGPQFAAKLIQEFWKKLGVKSSLSTAFHPQTDGQTERVNQELEQYLRIFCNFQQDNWAELIPFMEFAHNTRSHSATGKSPFMIWYSYHPRFTPPLQFVTNNPTVEERLVQLNRLRSEVTASLKLAAEVMKRPHPVTSSVLFKEGDLVWLEGTNIHTTHPKAKLAPKRHGPFKVLTTWGVNCKLQLPATWRIHPVFHNSLLSPYKETTAHGPNYLRPPPEVIGQEDDHYEVETILQSQQTKNRRGIQYLVKWKGYPDSDNSWEPASHMKNAVNLVTAFHKRYPHFPQPSNTAGAVRP